MRYASALALAAALALLPLAAYADDIEVSSAWARATAPGAMSGAIFLTVRNNGDADDSLTAVSTPVAEDAMLHQTVTDSSGKMPVSHMEMVNSLPLPAGQTTILAPGGTHIMLDGMQGALAQGKTFPATLTFAHHAPVTVTVHVAAAGASKAPD